MALRYKIRLPGSVFNCAKLDFDGFVGATSCSTTAQPSKPVWREFLDYLAQVDKVQVVSTIGAGDGFASGFLYGLVKGMPVVECLHYAAAAIVVSRLSCSEAMPTLAEVQEIIREQRSRAVPAV